YRKTCELVPEEDFAAAVNGGREMADRWAIAGVGQTAYSLYSGRNGFSLAAEAIGLALADAGLTPRDVDGMAHYTTDISTSAAELYLPLPPALSAPESPIPSSATAPR